MHESELGTFRAMKQRCNNPRNRGFHRYGARGIKVLWSTFEEFLRDMGPRPLGRSIDRIDNDGPYCKENCRWATSKQQARNKRTNYSITRDGETKCLAGWAEALGIRAKLLSARKSKGWSDEDILSPLRSRRAMSLFITHNGVAKSAVEWSKIKGLKYSTILSRIASGWDEERLLSPAVPREKRRWNTKDSVKITHDGQTRSINEWSEITGLRRSTIYTRMSKGWPEERWLDPARPKKPKGWKNHPHLYNHASAEKHK